MKPAFVVFDLDGTISDSGPAIVAASAGAAASVGRPTPCPAEVRSRIGLPLAQMVSELLPGLSSSQIATSVEAYRASYLDIVKAEEAVFDGMIELIERLAGAGLRMAVATGKGQAGADRVCDHIGISRLMDGVHGILPGTPGKPDPAVLYRAMMSMGASIESTVMVGDTSFDIDMARGIGVATAAVTWGMHAPERLMSAGATWIVEDVAGLEDVLRGRVRPPHVAG